MIRPAAAVLALLVLPLTSLAQDLGLDLSGEAEASQSEDTQSQESQTGQEDEAYDAAVSGRSSAPIQATPDSKRNAAKAPLRNGGTIQDLTDVERDITQDDRVKSVQRKVYLKRGRFELTPMFQVSVNDPYYFKLGGSLRLGYYLADTLAISVRGSLYSVQADDSARVARRIFASQLYYSVPQWSAMADVEWSPVYGKVAFMNDILHFDAYLLGGLGVVNTKTSSTIVDTVTNARRGPSPGADIGIGARFVARDFLAVNIALINTTYVDQPIGTTKGAIQNLMTLNAGVSIFLPFTSTGREAE